MTSLVIKLCLLFISGKEERERKGDGACSSCLVGYRAVVVRDRLARDVGGLALLVVRLAPVGAELCGVGDGCDVRHGLVVLLAAGRANSCSNPARDATLGLGKKCNAARSFAGSRNGPTSVFAAIRIIIHEPFLFA